MSDDEDMVRVNFQVQRHLRDAAKRNTERGEITSEGRRMMQRLAYGEEIEQDERLKTELTEKRKERDNKKAKVRTLQSEIENLETEITRLEEKVENRNERRDKYEGMLEMLEASLRDGVRIFPSHGQVKQAASVAGVSPEKVVAELKERNPEAPSHAFVPLPEDDTEFRGL